MIAFSALIDDPDDLLIFGELVERYQEEMIRIARSILADPQLAEDAVQNALYGIAVSFKKIPSDSLSAAHVYMLSCAKYAALRIRQKQETEIPLDLSEYVGLPSGADPTFEAIRNADDYDRLVHAIGQLDEKYQDVLLHYYVYHQSTREIAKLFGRNPSAVRQQLSRARQLLKELCRKEGIVDVP